MTKKKIVTALMLVSALVLVSAKHAQAQSDSMETLAQPALARYAEKWFQYPAHKTRAQGGLSIEWDEYKLKSPNALNTKLQKFPDHPLRAGRNRYQIIQTNDRGVVFVPSDDLMRKILRLNKIADLDNYVGSLESLPQYKRNHIKVELTLANKFMSQDHLQFSLYSQKNFVGSLMISRKTSPKDLTGALKSVAGSSVAYFDEISFDDSVQGLGLSYPLICAAFHAAKEIYANEYVLLQDAAEERPGIYEKLGFKRLEGATRNLKWAAINDVLGTERCNYLHR